MPAPQSSLQVLGEGPPETRGKRGRSRLFVIAALVFLTGHLALRVWYASEGLHAGRFWDENVNVDNARAILASGSFSPANGFYPTLAYVPQVLVIATIEWSSRHLGEGELRAFDSGDLRAEGYLAARVVTVLYSIAALVATFLLGCRIFSPTVGVIGTLFLAASPLHVHSAAYWKPDSLIVLTLLWVLLASAALLARPATGRSLTAGVAIGIAMSSKFTAAFSPLTVLTATLLGWRRSRSPLLGLAAAGLASLVVFLFLNPQIPLFLRDFGWTMMDYERHAVWKRHTRAEVITGMLLFPADPQANGPLVAGLAAIGVLVLAVLLARSRELTPRRALWILFLTFPLYFIFVYNLGTPRQKANNYAPLLPISSLLAAVPVGIVWTAARARSRRLQGPGAALLATAALVAATSSPPLRYVYQSLVPATEDLALTRLERGAQIGPSPGEARIVFREGDAEPGLRWERRRPFGNERSAVIAVERLTAVGAARLDRADAELFLAERLRGPDAAFYRRRIERVGASQAERFRPALFHARGREWVAVWHPWSRAAAVHSSSLRLVSDSFVGELQLDAPLLAGGLHSIAVHVPRRLQRGELQLRVGTTRLELQRSSRPIRKSGFLFLSERVELAVAQADRVPIELALAGAGGHAADIWIADWQSVAEKSPPR